MFLIRNFFIAFRRPFGSLLAHIAVRQQALTFTCTDYALCLTGPWVPNLVAMTARGHTASNLPLALIPGNLGSASCILAPVTRNFALHSSLLFATTLSTSFRGYSLLSASLDESEQNGINGSASLWEDFFKPSGGACPGGYCI